MNQVIHFAGICVKFIFINLLASLKLIFKFKKIDKLLFSSINTVVFTHNLGGGTESYEKNTFNKSNILMIRKISYRIDSIFSVENKKFSAICSSKKVFQILKNLSPDVVIVNSLCSYHNPQKIFSFIKENFPKSFHKYLVHDYQCLCTKNNAMLLQKGAYCELDCTHCYLNGKALQWRELWRSYFKIVNQIVCFSKSSKEFVIKIYPECVDKCVIQPHSLEYCKFGKIDITDAKNIGIIGNCSSIPKGKNVIKKLVPLIKKIKKRKLYIIGKAPFLFHKNSEFVKYTGKYDLKTLPEILSVNNIGVIVFTSICPETFSYAVSEFMLLGLPVVSLNLGAQGEKLSKYPKAFFINDLSPETIIDGVEKCFTR